MAASFSRRACSRPSHSFSAFTEWSVILVVPALVADGRGEFGIELELLVPVLLEEGVEGLAAILNRSGGGILSPGGGREQQERCEGRRSKLAQRKDSLLGEIAFPSSVEHAAGSAR